VSRAPAPDLTNVTWCKSTRSVGDGHCVEVGHYGDGIAVRNSNDPAAGALIFTGPEFTAFIDGVHDGEFDHLAV
jgi:hypothetical protein